MARMHIDPGAEEQPVDGVTLILSPALASRYFTICCPLLHPHPHLCLSSPYFLQFFGLSSAFPVGPYSHPHPPHGSNSLSGLSHSLQESRQSLQRLEQTHSFKQYYIGLAWSMPHTDRWKCSPLRHSFHMDRMKTGALQASASTVYVL